ncbi:putative NBD/HSP70 family sugar kinase [Arthrobacter pascens]|uniref:ROK family protein n=1 Tax=Arthrobacter pascens TaxID=1677 RepID=UPI00286589D2|nr:ROK family protein [Arthrobacter pascens]MDR6555754.1 putative NBD/HSP70 family sugar kinase [Arthrobacter pascens]
MANLKRANRPVKAQAPAAGGADAPPSLVDIRRHNLSATLKSVRDHGRVTRADLIAESGLNRVTVLHLVSELQEMGLIQESGLAATGKSGRPARVLEMSDGGLAVGALELNVDHVALKCTSLQGRVVFTERRDVSASDHPPEYVLDLAAELIKQAASAAAAEDMRIVRVSVGCPAFVDNADGVVLKSLSLGWKDVRVVEELERRSGGAVAYTLDKLADLAIHAERQHGGFPGEEGVLLLYGEMGVGGSFQKHSEILRGDAGMGGQFGHLTVNHDGRPCYCGRAGCLETYVGVAPLSRALESSSGHHSSSAAVRVSEALAAVQEGRGVAKRELADQGMWLARAVSTLTAIFDPRVIILGGYLTQLAPLLMPAFEKELGLYGEGEFTHGTEIVVSQLGTAAVLDGGIDTAISDLVRSPWTLTA